MKVGGRDMRFIFKFLVFSFLFFNPLFVGADITTGLNNHWPYDEGTGLTTSDVINSRNGSLQNMDSSNWVTGKIGDYALDFNGSDELVSVTDHDDFTVQHDMTWAMWIKPDNQPNDKNALVSTYSGGNGFIYALQDGASKRQQVYINGNWKGNSTTAIVEDGSWQHIAFVKKDTVGYFYYNGVLDGTVTGLNTNNANGSTLYLASNNSTYDFDGVIDDVRLYHTALNGDDILELYNFTGSGVGGGGFISYPVMYNNLMENIQEWTCDVDTGVCTVTATTSVEFLPVDNTNLNGFGLVGTFLLTVLSVYWLLLTFKRRNG